MNEENTSAANEIKEKSVSKGTITPFVREN